MSGIFRKSLKMLVRAIGAEPPTPGPEPGLELFLNFQGRREGEGVWNQNLAKPLFGADSKNLKIRRMPPTAPPRFMGLTQAATS